MEVRDTGIGIEKSIQSIIFDPFFTTKRLIKTHSGNGLGLTTVYRIVKNHNADIDVVSELGNGASFRITFPIIGSEKFSIAGNLDLTKGAGGILIIDDNQEILDILQEFLIKVGYTVFLADSGLSGIDIYRQHSTDITLVILNYIMPEINGINVYSILKTINSEIKILMITGYSNIDSYLSGLDLEGILPKPLDLINLSQIISKILSR